MATTCVLGTQWGDEGKARVIDLLAASADLVVRYQGGNNAGHTVVYDGRTYRLHLVPSGILRPGKINVVAHGVVVDPEMLLKEIDGLRERGVHIEENLVVSDRAQLVMPWHKRLDAAREQAAGKNAHGTTGRGIGPCYADKVSYRGIRVGDLYEEDWFAERLRLILDEKNLLLTKIFEEDPLDFDTILRAYRGHAKRLKPFVQDAVSSLLQARADGKEILFEGAQGVMLDVDLGSYPFVTGSNSCAVGVPSGTGLPPRDLDKVIGVAKAYLTRVGAGPFPTEDDGPEGQRLREVGKEYGTTTNRPRRCGWLDAVALRYACRTNGVDSIALTKLDVLQGFERIKVCVAYDTAEGRIDRVPATGAGLAAAKPVYRELPGFEEDVSGCRELSELPQNARDYVKFVEDEIGVAVSLVSVGPSREQVILLEGAR